MILYHFFLTLFLFSSFLFPFQIKGEAPLLKYLFPINLTAPTSGIEVIDAIYLINLERRIDRLKWMGRLLSSWGLSFNRVIACDGQTEISNSQINELVGFNDNALLWLNIYGPPKSAVACLISHLSVIKDAYERGFDIIWVLEDDVEILEDPHILNTIIQDLSLIDSDWDLFYTDLFPRKQKGTAPNSIEEKSGTSQEIEYYTAEDMKRRRLRDTATPPSLFNFPQIENKGNGINLIRWRTACHSMIISKKGLKKILDYFSTRTLFDHIDRELHLIPDIRLYASQRDIVTNALISESLLSDIAYRKN